MALRVPIPTGLKIKSDICSGFRPSSSGIGGRRDSDIKAVLKEQKRKGIVKLPNSCPLQRTEKLASALGLEIAVLELERLFREAGDSLHPQISGPYTPSLPAGFSRRPVRVAYQGVRGSYCQEAAMKAFSSSCNAFPCIQMEDAFEALKENAADRAVVPIENSVDGTIGRNLDLLIRHEDVEIVGELVLPVNHCLLTIPGISRSDLKRIVSHPQALSHCRKNLESLNVAEVEHVSNAAEAARYLSENRIRDTAVIGSIIAAKEFGLQVMEQNFQDELGNYNRFFHLGLKPEKKIYSPPLYADRKTTVAFSLENGVSDLHRALWQFESRNIAVTRIEHRPNRLNPVKVVEKETAQQRYFDYVFILDLEGCVTDSAVKTALLGLEEMAGLLRVLGSYTSAA